MNIRLTNPEVSYLHYEGPFGIQIISEFAKFLMENIMAPVYVRKKLYRVFIELAQNVALYSSERVSLTNNTHIGKGKVFIVDDNEGFKCITVNRITKEHAAVLERNCTEINTLPVPVLRAKKRNLNRKAGFYDTGAHIGLLSISIHSGNPIEFGFETCGDDYYFKIAVRINK